MNRQKRPDDKVEVRTRGADKSRRAAGRSEIMTAARVRRRSMAQPEAGAGSTRGAVSAPRVLERTGISLDHWFAVLDAFGAGTQGHTAAARHLKVDHGVDAWYAQSITVAWERHRRLRTLNQRCDGNYEVSVSRVVDAPPLTVAAAFKTASGRRRWLSGQDATIVGDLERHGKQMKVVEGGLVARLRFQAGGHTTEVRVDAKPKGRASVVAQVSKLERRDEVEDRRAAWRGALESLRASLAGPA